MRLKEASGILPQRSESEPETRSFIRQQYDFIVLLYSWAFFATLPFVISDAIALNSTQHCWKSAMMFLGAFPLLWIQSRLPSICEKTTLDIVKTAVLMSAFLYILVPIVHLCEAVGSIGPTNVGAG